MSWAKYDEKRCEVSCSWPTFHRDGSLRPEEDWDSLSSPSLRYVRAKERERHIAHYIPRVAASAFVKAKLEVISRERLMVMHHSLERILAARRRFWARCEAL